MTSSVSITATYADNKPLSALNDLIAKRERFLRGETTENAVRATAINVLSSIRARTKVADPKKAGEFGVGVMPAPGVVAGYKGVSGTRHARLVVRAHGGHEMAGAKVVNLAGTYQRGAQLLVFVVIFKSPKVANFFKGGYERVYVVARSAGEVRKWATNKLSNYVKRFRGMAKWALGQAQSQVHNINVGTIGAAAQRVALNNIIVQATGDGWNSGTFQIYVADKLDYATLALQGKSADVDLALMKAANRTAGIINKLGRARLDETIQTPFPEVAGKS